MAVGWFCLGCLKLKVFSFMLTGKHPPYLGGCFSQTQNFSSSTRAITPCRNAITCCCSGSGNSLALLNTCISGVTVGQAVITRQPGITRTSILVPVVSPASSIQAQAGAAGVTFCSVGFTRVMTNADVADRHIP